MLPSDAVLVSTLQSKASADAVQQQRQQGCESVQMCVLQVSKNEPNSASARLCASGGRAAEPQAGHGVGAMQVGMRARAPLWPCARRLFGCDAMGCVQNCSIWSCARAARHPNSMHLA